MFENSILKIINKRIYFFIFSIAIIAAGLAFLFIYGLRLGVDFSGGSLIELQFNQSVDQNQVKEAVSSQQVELSTITSTGENIYLLRTKTIDQEKNDELKKALVEKFGEVEEVRFETIGPAVSKEIGQNALKAIVISILAIVIYVSWSFRKVPSPASSVNFGMATIVALVHDVLVVVGAFAIFGHYFGAEIDSLFVTAILTVIGFSVHDTIVVFDRVRENLNRHPGFSFEQTVNHSILQTLVRSLSTSLTLIFVLVALLIFGGATLKWFMLALLIGVMTGTYSSIFTASQLLIVWQNWTRKKKEVKI
ncbi:MAG TPA: protein translocase subunit SecF [Patescibacteria group bacterium]